MGVLDGFDPVRLRPGWQVADAAPPPPVARPAASPVAQQMRALTEVALERRAPEKFAEIKRITGLPFLTPVTPEQAEIVSRREILAPAYRDGFRLWPVQAEAILTWDAIGGLFGAIGCGWGKTLTTLMIAERAWRAGKRRIMLIVPSAIMRPQLLGTRGTGGGMLEGARHKVPITYPCHPVEGTPQRRRNTLESGYPGLYVGSYEILSRSKTCPLSVLEPEVVICDEAHNLKSVRDSARAKRFMRYIEAREPQCAFLSGTITGKGILDYWHLIKAALGTRSPLPLQFNLAEEWSRVIDSGAAPSKAEKGPMRPLVDWALDRAEDPSPYQDNVSGFRAAYKLRLSSAPGVVSTGDAQIGTSLIFVNDPAPVDPERADIKELERLINQVQGPWLTPNLDEIEYPIHIYKWMYELTSGFYNEQYWPTAEQYAKHRSIGVAEATDILNRAQDHHAAKNDYNKALRGWLQENHVPGLETPLHIGAYMAREGRFPDMNVYALWRRMKVQDFDDRPDRWSRVVRVSPYKIEHAANWVERHGKKGAILWWYHNAMGEWLNEELTKRFGDRIVFCPAGNSDVVLSPKSRGKVLLMSVSGYGTGTDGIQQHFTQQLYVQWPRVAVTAEQSLSRLHRPGQKADELQVFRCDTTEFDVLNFAACLNDAIYIHQSTNLRQKLVYGSYDPLPRVAPSEWLSERGFQAKKLNAEQQALRFEKFGA